MCMLCLPSGTKKHCPRFSYVYILTEHWIWYISKTAGNHATCLFQKGILRITLYLLIFIILQQVSNFQPQSYFCSLWMCIQVDRLWVCTAVKTRVSFFFFKDLRLKGLWRTDEDLGNDKHAHRSHSRFSEPKKTHVIFTMLSNPHLT